MSTSLTCSQQASSRHLWTVRAAASRCLAGKLGTQPDRVLLALMNDRMVAKGTILQWATIFFQVLLLVNNAGLHCLLCVGQERRRSGRQTGRLASNPEEEPCLWLLPR